MLHARPRKLTVEEFIRDYEGLDEKYELIDGEAWAMAGASKRHNRISGNIYVSLRGKLRGSRCEPFGSDARLLLDDGNIRFPDVAVYCDPRDIGPDDQPTMSFPKLVFEVLSPSTGRNDRLHKLREYQRIDSLDAIVLIDPATQAIDVYVRSGAAEWHVANLAPGAPLVLRDPAVTLTHAEIFEDA